MLEALHRSAPGPGAGGPQSSDRPILARGSLFPSLGRRVALLVLPLLLAVSSERGRAGAWDEYQVKAAFLFRFTQFVEWPDAALPPGPMIIGIAGQDPFGQQLDTVAEGEVVRGHKLVIKRISSDQEISGCHVIFISASEQARVAQILKASAGASVLTIGEMDQFCQAGGMINLVKDGNNIRFEINAQAVEQAQLKVRSQLLRLAKVIKPGNGRD